MFIVVHMFLLIYTDGMHIQKEEQLRWLCIAGHKHGSQSCHRWNHN